MQTSKSYGTGSNNSEIKLELEDLEYVFAGGQNLIINSGDAANDDGDDQNIVYADEAQPLVIQSGVKHYIQTVDGETYLVGNDTENIQQLVINTEDQSEESNSTFEYVQGEENGEPVIYKLAESESEIYETQQPQAKRFKIGDTEYVRLNDSDSLTLSENDRFSIVDENSISENGGFQYAILKDGKLHLQLCDTDTIEVLNDEIETQSGNNGESLEDSQEYVIVNTNLATDSTLDLSKIASRDFLTGKTVTLDDYLNQVQYKVNQRENVKNNQAKVNLIDQNNQKYNQYLNKKLLIRKNPNGKSLFGKILHIEPAKKIAEEEMEEVEIRDVNANETDILNLDAESSNVDQIHEDEDNEVQEVISDDAGPVVNINNSSQVGCNQEVTEEQMYFLSKTLSGLVEIPNLRKKLMDCRLDIKYIEKKLNGKRRKFTKDIRFVSGRLMQEDSEFVRDDSEEQQNVISLTVSVTKGDEQKTTNVTIHEKDMTCQMCNSCFQSLELLNKHMQTNHPDRTIGCNICQWRFANHVLLTEHRKAYGHYFKCEICNKRFITKCNLTRHQSVHCQNLKHIECAICKTRFVNLSALSKHFATHTHKAYQCDTCGKSFTTLSDLNVHRKVHNLVKKCYCAICGREFTRHSNLQRHMEIHRGDGDLYRCGICDCSYKYISSLTRHIVQNHMKQSN